MPQHRKTCRRFNDSGHAHFLTFSCYRRQPLLSQDRSRQWMLEAIDRARTQHEFPLWAYVIMPEHVHLLIWPARSEYSISAILKSLKQSVARRALTFVKRDAPEFLKQMEDRQPNGQLAYRIHSCQSRASRAVPPADRLALVQCRGKGTSRVRRIAAQPGVITAIKRRLTTRMLALLRDVSHVGEAEPRSLTYEASLPEIVADR